MVFGPAGKSSIFEVWAAPVAPKTIPKNEFVAVSTNAMKSSVGQVSDKNGLLRHRQGIKCTAKTNLSERLNK